MNYREQQELRHKAQGLGRPDLAAALDKTAEELDELADQTRYAHREWRTASDKQDAKAEELKDIQRQIRDLTAASRS